MLVYLNGEWLPDERARISVFDRGFTFGDGVYEVIPVYASRPFRVERHVARLKRSLGGTRIDTGYTDRQWFDLLDNLGQHLPMGEGSIYLQVTRGVSLRQHTFPARTPPTVFAYARPAIATANRDLAQGIAAALLADIRWARCDIKTTSLIANVLLTQEAADRGASEALLVRDNQVREGAASNVFAVRHGRLYTAPADHLILSGITRELVLELARQHAVDVIEESPTVEDVCTADEVLITSSGRGMLAVTTIDGAPVGDGRPGALFRLLYEALQTFKDAVRRGEVR
ncbi:MAG: aminotransferase class IV [Gammaproteobacteria bacterium]|nr:aminotransferase class IV [Gammaproteobacteria bacterium]